ncbi:MAG: hypothetical protein M3R61_12990 [Chloroflexota bacterium]|nr:hypothetical protein [Chloroflexota bacterium]
MILSAALLAGVKGYDVWFQLKSIAGLVLGPVAIAQAGFVAGPVLLRLTLYLALSALLGAIFAIGMRKILRLPSDFGLPVVAGLVFGLLLWLGAYLALPALLPQLIAFYAPAFIMQYIVYGTSPAWYIAWCGHIPTRRSDDRAEGICT